MLDQRFLVRPCGIEREYHGLRLASCRPSGARLVARQNAAHRLDEQCFPIAVPCFHGQHRTGVIGQIDQHEVAAHRPVVLPVQQGDVQGELAFVHRVLPRFDGVKLFSRHQQALDFLHYQGVVSFVKAVQPAVHVHRIVIYLKPLPQGNLGLIGRNARLLLRLVLDMQVAPQGRTAAQPRRELDAAGEYHSGEEVPDAQPQGAGWVVKSNSHSASGSLPG